MHTKSFDVYIIDPTQYCLLCLSLTSHKNVEKAPNIQFMRSAKNAIAIVIMLAFIMGILELGLRLSKKYQTYSEKNGEKFHSDYGNELPDWFKRYSADQTWKWPNDEFDIEHRTNSLGYREGEPTWDTAINKIRLLTLGDSFTEGVGTDYDSTWPRYLERMLLETYPEAQPEVLNFGIAGSDPFYEYMAWKHHGKILEPTHVILAFNSTDLSDYILRGGMDRFLPDSTTQYRSPPLNLNLYEKSHLYRWITHNIRGCNYDLIPRSQIPQFDALMLEELNEQMTEFSREAQDAGTKLLLVLHPLPVEICDTAGTDDLRIGAMVRNEKNYPNVEIVHRFKALRKTYGCYEIAWPIDGHYNSKGYQLFTEQLWLEIESSMPEFFETD